MYVQFRWVFLCFFGGKGATIEGVAHELTRGEGKVEGGIET
jgi:hypothetical protein